MSDLYVIDISALVHTAEHTPNFSERRYYDYPVGGIHFLMRYVSIAFARGDAVVLCFDSPTFRKDLFTGYKNGRLRNAPVIGQIETVYQGLSACGIRCEKHNGFEADDIVNWAVEQNLAQYEELIIVGNDYDLCHSIQQKVRFKTVHHKMNNIFRGNFEESIYQGKWIMFNTISAYKVFCGCTSDCIPVLSLQCGLHGYKLYNTFLDFIKKSGLPLTYANTASSKLVMLFITKSRLFTSEEQLEVVKRIKLVYPAACPEGVKITPTRFFEIDKDALMHFLTMYNDYDSIRCLGGKKVFLSEEDKQRIRDKGKSLRNGEYATDHDMEHRTIVASTTLKLDSFSREF